MTPSVKTWCRNGPVRSRPVDEAGAAALSVARFAALFGLDTRLGIYCFDVCSVTTAITLHLNRLPLSVQACSKRDYHQCLQDCKQLRRERGLEGPLLPLSLQDLANIRECAEQHYQQALAHGENSRQCWGTKWRDAFNKMPAELIGPVKETDLQWATTLISDGAGAKTKLPTILSAIFGHQVEMPLRRHVQLGLVPTAQRLRSRLECAEDASKVAAAVEEMEFFVGRAPVPRPPEAW